MIRDLDMMAALVRGFGNPGTSSAVREAKRRVLYRRGVALKDTKDEVVDWLDRADGWLRENPDVEDREERDSRWIACLRAYERAEDSLAKARTAL